MSHPQSASLEEERREILTSVMGVLGRQLARSG